MAAVVNELGVALVARTVRVLREVQPAANAALVVTALAPPFAEQRLLRACFYPLAPAARLLGGRAPRAAAAAQRHLVLACRVVETLAASAFVYLAVRLALGVRDALARLNRTPMQALCRNTSTPFAADELAGDPRSFVTSCAVVLLCWVCLLWDRAISVLYRADDTRSLRLALAVCVLHELLVQGCAIAPAAATRLALECAANRFAANAAPRAKLALGNARALLGTAASVGLLAAAAEAWRCRGERAELALAVVANALALALDAIDLLKRLREQRRRLWVLKIY
jgi:hypothetical protein